MNQSRFATFGNFKTFPISDHDPHCRVIIKDPKALQAKFAKLKHDGFDNLMVTTDFDQTITSFNNQGQPSLSSFSLFRFHFYRIVNFFFFKIISIIR